MINFFTNTNIATSGALSPSSSNIEWLLLWAEAFCFCHERSAKCLALRRGQPQVLCAGDALVVVAAVRTGSTCGATCGVWWYYIREVGSSLALCVTSALL